jgi:outer membrane protein OmpA-like peptidoglycan-associated protein
MTKHTLNVASFTATNPKVHIERDSEKRWMFERWLKTPAGGAAAEAKVAAPKPAGAGSAAAAPGANTKPWALTIGTLAVDNGTLSYADKASATPVAVEITALNLNAQKVAPETSTVSPLQISGRIGSRRAEPGRFDYKGHVVLKPLSAEGRLEVASFPAHAFKAYYADALNVDIRRAFASYRGTVRYASAPAGMTLKLAGDTALDDFRANSISLTQSPGFDRNTNQLLSWKTLSLRGLQVSMAPNAPPAVDVRETTLTDFFARVIVDPTGRLNLLNLTKKGEAEGNAAAATSAEAKTRRSLGGTSTTTAEAMVGGSPEPARPASAPVATAQAEADTGPKPVINFGPMSLVNGRIDFTDLFVKPNYSADLSELTGKLSSFSSNPPKGESGRPALADLELRGKAQQTAALEITGKLNPLAKPLELDITAKMRDLDLAPLSPYSVRYSGHGIERGKMSMDVNYKIAADGQLTATNKLVLNQLQFGDEVQGAPNSLPVRLAVALLADRNGVIDVDLPLRGSLNDPQFSIGPLIFKAIVNLIVKAATSPFSLLTGGLGGGSGESSTVTFEPGSSVLSASAKESLDKVAKALTERPTLQMTVVGTSSLEQERDAYQRQRLRQLAQAEKRRAAVRGGQAGTDVPPVTDAEYPELLTAVYKRADITKPRNMVGLAKDLPVKEMENLLITSIPVDEESMRQLAVERGAVVRDYLLAQKLPSERLFLGAVKTKASGADWKPGAELNLAMK